MSVGNSTLFLRHSSRDFNWDGVTAEVSRMPGFQQYRVVRDLLFVDFRSVADASEAMGALKRSRLGGDGLHVDFDKSKSKSGGERFGGKRSRSPGGPRPFHPNHPQQQYGRGGEDRRPPRHLPSSSETDFFEDPHVEKRAKLEFHPLAPHNPKGSIVTLEVTVLPADITDREFSIPFRLFSGCLSTRLMPRSPGFMPHGVVEFEDITHAEYAMQFLQHFRIDPRDPEGMKIRLVDCYGMPIGSSASSAPPPVELVVPSRGGGGPEGGGSGYGGLPPPAPGAYRQHHYRDEGRGGYHHGRGRFSQGGGGGGDRGYPQRERGGRGGSRQPHFGAR